VRKLFLLKCDSKRSNVSRHDERVSYNRTATRRYRAYVRNLTDLARRLVLTVGVRMHLRLGHE
jgi:hypothetical protein